MFKNLTVLNRAHGWSINTFCVLSGLNTKVRVQQSSFQDLIVLIIINFIVSSRCGKAGVSSVILRNSHYIWRDFMIQLQLEDGLNS